MENLAIVIFTVFMSATIISILLFIVGLIKKDFKFKPKKRIIGICIVGFFVSVFFYGAVETPETKAGIEAKNKIEEEQKAIEKAKKEEKEALEKADKEALKLKEEEDKLAKEKAKEEENKAKEKDKADKEALAKKEQEELEKKKKEDLAKKEQEKLENNKKEESNNKTEEKTTQSKRNWEVAINDTKKALTNKEYYSYVDGIQIDIDEEKKQISMCAALYDSVDPKIALDFADTMIRRFNTEVKFIDNSIKSATKEYFGGLYDEYSLTIGVAPLSKSTEIKEWFVYDSFSKGNIRQLKLQKKYR